MRMYKLPVFVALLLLSFSAGAQLMNLSPYSRFGIGDIYNSGSPANLGLGGVKTTFNDASILNPENPATLGSLFNTTLQTSIRINSVAFSDGDESNRLNNGNLDQFQMAFKRPGAPMGYMLGISPVSTTGYVISTSSTVPDVGEVLYTYEGKGGITKAYVGFGRKFNVSRYKVFNDKDGLPLDSVKVNYHSISAGVNFNYLFGNVAQSRLVNIQNTTFLGTRATDNFRMSDFSTDIGFHYQVLLRAKFGKDRKLAERMLLQVAGVYSPEININTKVESYRESVVFQQMSAFPIDTAFALVGEGSSNMPQRIRGGLAFHHYRRSGRHVMIAADYEVRDWTQFRTTVGDSEMNPGLLRASELSVGAQYTPKPVEEGNNIFERTQYRVGFRNTATYLEVGGNQVMDQAFTAGFSIPMISSRSASKFHLGMEIGRRGKNDGIMIQEDYVNAYIGFSLSPFFKNAWFIQRKYD